MRKTKRNIIIFIVVIIALVAFSYYLFKSGATDKIKGQINKMTAVISPAKGPDDYPVIKFVFNSSGEKMVNNDVSLTIDVVSKYKVTNVSYSFDKKTWYDAINEFKYGNNVSEKITFTKTMNKTVYLRAENEKGYQSYYYETKVMIDKERPVVKVRQKNDKILISASDNVGVSRIQYSNDKLNWIDASPNTNKVMINKSELGYSYVRAVDVTGNISMVKKIND